MKGVHGFNTGRLYQADGQRISFTIVDGDLLFNDHSRGISGRVTAEKVFLNPRFVLNEYDYNRYVYDPRADRVKADIWPRL